jgi:hypothetical protein|uniref:Uncharacterized protein n=1 Tax=Zea mays TaxID=4577 RepID=A0A804LE46_MAIZE
MAASSTMSWAVMVAVVVLMMQCCNVVVAARPLLMMEAPAVATADGGWLEMIMQVLQGPGSNNHNCQAPNGSCP